MALPPVLASAPGLRAAELVIDGLSVCCFNRTSSEMFWEVAYPRQRQHELRITIQELDGADQPVGQPQPHDVDARVVSFNINLTNGSVAHYGQFPRGGPAARNFDRNAPDNDPHDLGWIIDLAGSELRHGNFLGLKPRHPSRPISLARIRHSLFCTLEPEDEDVIISPRPHDHTHPDSFVLGRNNTEIVGVLLATAPGEIRFESEPVGLLNISPLPYDQNRRYRIEIINTDTHSSPHVPPYVKGDLHLFYDDVIDVDGDQKALWAKPARPGKRFAPDGDCHTNGFGGSTLQPLIEP